MASIVDGIKQGPSISEVARNLGISRAALYRYMEQYDKGETDGMNKEVLEYLTKISSNEFKSREQAVQYLNQVKELREAKNESDNDRYADLRRKIFTANRDLLENASTMTQEDFVKKSTALASMKRELMKLDEANRLQFRRARYDDRAESKWFQDEGIRSAVISGNEGAMIVIDASYETCQGAIVDLYVMIEGEMIPLARRRPRPDERFVMTDVLQIGLSYGYKITWTADNTVRTTDIHEFKTW